MDMDGDKSQENKMGKKDSDKIFPSTTLKWIKFNTEHVGFFVSFFHPPKSEKLHINILPSQISVLLARYSPVGIVLQEPQIM